MKTALILFTAALPAFSQQIFDFKSLDKMGANAKESTNVTLEGDSLKLALSFLGSDEEAIKSMVNNVKGIYVRSYEFAKPGEYNQADLVPFRAYLKTLQWNKIVDVKESNESTEIYLQPLPNNRLGGLAILSVEPQEMTLVFIIGAMNLSDVAKLGGNLGIPDMSFLNNGKKAEEKKKD
jgi:hypothetical protein